MVGGRFDAAPQLAPIRDVRIRQLSHGLTLQRSTSGHETSVAQQSTPRQRPNTAPSPHRHLVDSYQTSGTHFKDLEQLTSPQPVTGDAPPPPANRARQLEPFSRADGLASPEQDEQVIEGEPPDKRRKVDVAVESTSSTSLSKLLADDTSSAKLHINAEPLFF